MKKLDKKYPPIYGTLSVNQYEMMVDEDSFPKCNVCGNPILNPLFYEGDMECHDMCGPCTTGEADTIM